MGRKHTQSEVRKKDIEIDPEEKPLTEFKFLPPSGPRIKTVTPGYYRDDKMAKEAGWASDEEFRKQVAKNKRTLATGGMVSASKRADGCAVKGKTKGKMV